MATLKIKKLNILSFAKIFALYSFFASLVLAIIDLLIKLITGASAFTTAVSWGGWVLYMLGTIILSPILGYIFALVLGWLINLALKTGSGLDLEVE